MVQFLSINFCCWISSIFVGFFKSSRFFCVSLCNLKTVTQVAFVIRIILLASGILVNIATPILVASSSKACVCGHSLAEIAGSNPAGCMDVCRLWVLCVIRQRSATGRSITRPEESYRVWCYWAWSLNLKNEETLAHWGCRTPKHSNLNQHKDSFYFKNYKIQNCT